MNNQLFKDIKISLPSFNIIYIIMAICIGKNILAQETIPINEAPDETAKQNQSLYGQLEKQQLEFENNRLERAFSNIDKLFDRAIVKTQTIDDKEQLGPENIYSLSHFLSLPHDLPTIIKNIEAGLNRKLKPFEIEILSRDPVTFPKAVRLLWQEQSIDDKKASMLLARNCNMTPDELLRLVENGAAKTKTGFLVQLRTGSSYGDTLKLFETISSAAKKLKETASAWQNIDPNDLLIDHVEPDLLAALTDHIPDAQEIVSDARVIKEMRRHFLFISNLGMPIRFRPGTVDFMPGDVPGPVSVNRNNSADLLITPRTLSATLIGNFYINGIDASSTHGLFINPMGITYGGSLNFDSHGSDWWLSYSDGFLGGGLNYTVNFDQGTFWSNGQPSYLSVGFMAGGWRNNITAGVSMTTALANSIGIGASATMSISRSHDVSYLGEYPIDGKFAAIRGLHKIEIDDLVGVSGAASVAVNLTAADVPLTIAFRAGAERTIKRLYRTHVDLGKAQKMLSESEIPGLLFLFGKKIKETRLPKFENPELLIDGDELVETKIGKLSGAFVIGIETLVPIHAGRLGGSIEVAGEFELGLRRLPNDKFEVSIEPRRIFEMGLFGSILNCIGAGQIKSIALARKQIFIFDFINPEAKRAYFDLIHHGRMPTSEEIEVYAENRGPEYLLTEFRAQNIALLPRGIARTYLEKIRIVTSKQYIGISAPIIPAALTIVNKIDKEARKSKQHLQLHFEGFDRERIRAHAKSMATNGLISVRRVTSGGRRSEGQGFSGRYNRDLFVTHRRIHSIDDSPHEFGGNKWQFDSILVHAQLEDTVITGNEENEMAEEVNRLFSTFIGSFEYKNSKAPRTINLEREFRKKDLDELTLPETRERISVASQTTGISTHKLSALLKMLKNKHPDYQGILVKQFIETNRGLTGFAAIHQLLGAKPDHLFIRTESGYANAITDAKKFIAIYSKADNTSETIAINLVPLDTKKNKKRAKKFYNKARTHLREIDNQLRLLYDDKYLIDDQSPLMRIYGKNKVKELIDTGARQDKTPYKSALVSSRKTILELLNLSNQGFNDEERKIIYKMAGRKRLRLQERIEIILNKYAKLPISPIMEKKYLRKRLNLIWGMIAKIDDRISRLENDQLMISMDKEYIDNTIEKFIYLRSRLADCLNIDHLSSTERQIIKNKLESTDHPTFTLFRRKKFINYRLEGPLANAYREGDLTIMNDEAAFKNNSLYVDNNQERM